MVCYRFQAAVLWRWDENCTRTIARRRTFRYNRCSPIIKVKVATRLISVFWGQHVRFKEVKSYKKRVVTIQSSTIYYVYADGDHIGYIPLTIDLQAMSLEVLTRRCGKAQVDLKKERDSDDFC